MGVKEARNKDGLRDHAPSHVKEPLCSASEDQKCRKGHRGYASPLAAQGCRNAAGVEGEQKHHQYGNIYQVK